MTIDTANGTLERIARALTTLTRGPRTLRLHRVLNARAGVELDRPAFLALITLWGSGPLRVSELAEACAVEISTMSRLVTRLTGEGLVVQRAAPGDRRVVMVDLTDAGSRLVERLKEVRQAAMAEVLAGWSESERETFAELLDRFVEGLHQISSACPRDCSATQAGDHG